ncbi:phosphate ABC transporter permease PstA [Halapricum sp. CBA1109]|uniref:phosphate ABC transporter permease PstA n=1 Tax=Halapricum sp. CBA1109 TaxID=2668068 RepID=UPI0012F7FB4F|nr:phosphate ABC transporter permease PstA [Halapricum sp. CBA1109]MUV89867.1 phosphate ABC transporter permease PstA [Halapricum sp. CBA1109]
MSEGYATEETFTTADADAYDRWLDTTIAVGILGFVLAMAAVGQVVTLTASGDALNGVFLTLSAVVTGAVGLTAGLAALNVVAVESRRVRGVGLGLLAATLLLTAVVYATGVQLVTLFGLVLLVDSVSLVGAGIASWTGSVDTQPNASAGILTGSVFALVGFGIGAAVGGAFLDGPLYLVAGLLGAALFGVGTIVPREDIGSTLPTAAVTAVFAAVILTGAIGPDWQWLPEGLSGGFSGVIVVPLFVLFGSLFTSWSAAKCRARFGARGRQYGAFLVIYLNAVMMVAVMVSIVFFVVSRGVTYAFHGVQIGALSLLVLLAPLLVLAINRARNPSGTSEWHSAARQSFRIAPVAAIGSLAVVLVGLIVTGETLDYAFEYTVLGDGREEVPIDTVAAITPETAVGAWVLAFPTLILAVYFFRNASSLRGVGTRSPTLERVQQAVPLVGTGLALATIAYVLVGTGFPVLVTVGTGLVVAGAAAAAGATLFALSALTSGPEGLLDNAQYVPVGLAGGVTLLAVTAFLEPTVTVSPGVGPIDIVPAVALLGVLVGAVVAVAAAVARNRGGDDRVFVSQALLGLSAVCGFLTILGLHAAFTGAPVDLGVATVANVGSFDWPFVMQSYVPLGIEPGGIYPAVIGTVWLVVGASTFAIPLGVGAAVFLTEYIEQGSFTAVVETATNALWSTPSVVFGLFGAALLIPRLGDQRSLLAGMLVLGFMLLPLVLITSREAIKSVPDEYRDASAALGVSRWETIRSVVLPAAMPGVITGVILGVGRIAGETAPLILVLGSTLNTPNAADVLGNFQLLSSAPFVFNGAVMESTAALPTGIWATIAAGVSGSQSRGWGTALVLLLVVLMLYSIGIVSRTYFRRKLNYE